jgi:hypothetical protein
MNTLLTTLLVSGALIAVAEFLFWRLFRRKIEGLLFPHELDASIFHFFTLPRMKLVAVAHTLFLIVTISLLLLFLW